MIRTWLCSSVNCHHRNWTLWDPTTGGQDAQAGEELGGRRLTIFTFTPRLGQFITTINIIIICFGLTIIKN